MNTSIIIFITSLTALTSSIIGPLVALKTAKTQFNAAVLSSNRQRWIDALRELIAQFQSQLVGAAIVRQDMPSGSFRDLSTNPILATRAEHLILTVCKIRLMTNPSEADHMTLLQLMQRGVDTIRTRDAETVVDAEIELLIEEITKTSQQILKREWNRVKLGR